MFARRRRRRFTQIRRAELSRRVDNNNKSFIEKVIRMLIRKLTNKFNRLHDRHNLTKTDQRVKVRMTIQNVTIEIRSIK